jgi:hypothetical protein
VALATKGFAIAHHEFLGGGGMGLVTVKAALLVHQGPVHTVLRQHVIHYVVMTSPTEIETCPFYLEWRGRSGLLVTLVAHSFGHRCMDVIKEHSCRVGSMSVVAGGAVAVGYRIIHMCLAEIRSIRLMAIHTERDNVCLE